MVVEAQQSHLLLDEMKVLTTQANFALSLSKQGAL